MVKVTRQCFQHHHHQSYEEDARLPDEDYQYQPQHQAAVYQRYQEAEELTEIRVVVDSDWAGDQVTRRSRGGGFGHVGFRHLENGAEKCRS